MWSVEWKLSAMDNLANDWIAADSEERQQITAAAHAVHENLSQDPFVKSESRLGNRRVMFCPPLVVEFVVNSDSRIVTVAQVRFYRPRNK